MTPKAKVNLYFYGGLFVNFTGLAVFSTLAWADYPSWLVWGIGAASVLIGFPFTFGSTFIGCPHCGSWQDLRGPSAYCTRCGQWIPFFKNGKKPDSKGRRLYN